eukprot:Rhum_TRINITY_DN20636_c0_g1::Rhum_TRINITY_DN20636_c0_g1_i1::g.171563::m.171563
MPRSKRSPRQVAGSHESSVRLSASMGKLHARGRLVCLPLPARERTKIEGCPEVVTQQEATRGDENRAEQESVEKHRGHKDNRKLIKRNNVAEKQSSEGDGHDDTRTANGAANSAHSLEDGLGALHATLLVLHDAGQHEDVVVDGQCNSDADHHGRHTPRHALFAEVVRQVAVDPRERCRLEEVVSHAERAPDAVHDGDGHDRGDNERLENDQDDHRNGADQNGKHGVHVIIDNRSEVVGNRVPARKTNLDTRVLSLLRLDDVLHLVHPLLRLLAGRREGQRDRDVRRRVRQLLVEKKLVHCLHLRGLQRQNLRREDQREERVRDVRDGRVQDTLRRPLLRLLDAETLRRVVLKSGEGRDVRSRCNAAAAVAALAAGEGRVGAGETQHIHELVGLEQEGADVRAVHVAVAALTPRPDVLGCAEVRVQDDVRRDVVQGRGTLGAVRVLKPAHHKVVRLKRTRRVRLAHRTPRVDAVGVARDIGQRVERRLERSKTDVERRKDSKDHDDDGDGEALQLQADAVPHALHALLLLVDLLRVVDLLKLVGAAGAKHALHLALRRVPRALVVRHDAPLAPAVQAAREEAVEQRQQGRRDRDVHAHDDGDGDAAADAGADEGFARDDRHGEEGNGDEGSAAEHRLHRRVGDEQTHVFAERQPVHDVLPVAHQQEEVVVDVHCQRRRHHQLRRGALHRHALCDRVADAEGRAEAHSDRDQRHDHQTRRLQEEGEDDERHGDDEHIGLRCVADGALTRLDRQHLLPSHAGSELARREVLRGKCLGLVLQELHEVVVRLSLVRRRVRCLLDREEHDGAGLRDEAGGERQLQRTLHRVVVRHLHAKRLRVASLLHSVRDCTDVGHDAVRAVSRHVEAMVAADQQHDDGRRLRLGPVSHHLVLRLCRRVATRGRELDHGAPLELGGVDGKQRAHAQDGNEQEDRQAAVEARHIILVLILGVAETGAVHDALQHTLLVAYFIVSGHASSCAHDTNEVQIL